MEAYQRVEVTDVLTGNTDLGSGAQRAGVGVSQVAVHVEGEWVWKL
jgi:hypothetical protein